MIDPWWQKALLFRRIMDFNGDFNGDFLGDFLVISMGIFLVISW